jgi:thiamine biosynthesis lipoprotein
MISGIPPVSSSLTRRSFLALSGILGLNLVSLSLPVPSEASKFSNKLHIVSMSNLGMGTYVNMTVLHGSKDAAQEALGLAYEEIERLSRLMNRHDASSPVSYLNNAGTLEDAPPEVLNVIHSSIKFYQVSGGSFDITVKPALDLYADSFKGKEQPPTEQELGKILHLLGSNKIQIAGSTVSFARQGMGITLDSIAKGYILDRAMQVLRDNGIKHGLINAGGDIAMYGGKGTNRPWRVAIQDPWHPDRSINVIEMSTGAVATSGNYEIFFDQEKIYHHIISPATGIPAEEIASVSIQAANVMTADALATAVFVKGPKNGRQFIERAPGIEGLIIKNNKEKMFSGHWIA